MGGARALGATAFTDGEPCKAAPRRFGEPLNEAAQDCGDVASEPVEPKLARSDCKLPDNKRLICI